MTSPADQPPPDPERGNPARLRWVRVLFAITAVLVLVAAILSAHNGVASVSAGAAASAFLVAAFVILAWKGRKS